MEKYLWLVFLLIVVFLLVRNVDVTKGIINSLSHAQLGTIVSLQGGNPGAYING